CDSTLFPYTTLFRSGARQGAGRPVEGVLLCQIGVLLLLELLPLAELVLSDAGDVAPQALSRDLQLLLELAQAVSRGSERTALHVAPNDLTCVVVSRGSLAGELGCDPEDPLPALAKRRLELVDLAGQGDLHSLQGISAQVGDLAEQIVRGSLADGRQVTDAHVDRLDEAVE